MPILPWPELSAIEAAALQGEAERLRADGATVVLVAIDGKLAGLIAIADPIKPTTRAALEALKGAETSRS